MRQIKRVDAQRAEHLKHIEFYDGLVEQLKRTAEAQQMQAAMKATHANTVGALGEDAVDEMGELVDDMNEQKQNITEIMGMMSGSMVGPSDAVTDEDLARFLPEMAMGMGGGAFVGASAAAAPYVPSAAANAAHVGLAVHLPVPTQPVMSKADEDMLAAYS